MSEIKSFRSSSRILLEDDDDMLGTKTPPMENEDESTIHNEQQIVELMKEIQIEEETKQPVSSWNADDDIPLTKTNVKSNNYVVQEAA